MGRRPNDAVNPHGGKGESRSTMVEFRGQLRWNDLVGGVWSLEVDPDSNGSGSTLTLIGFEPDAGAYEDGSRVLVRGELEEGGGDIMMLGPRLQVASVVHA
jgi:hypothetical protein